MSEEDINLEKDQDKPKENSSKSKKQQMNPSSIVALVDNVILQTHEIPRINIEAFLLISGHIAILSKTIFMKKSILSFVDMHFRKSQRYR